MAEHNIINLVVVIGVLIVMIGLYLSIRHIYKIEGGNLKKYDVGGRHNDPSIEISIDSIERIQKVEKNGKLKYLKIFRKGDQKEILTINTENSEKILNELLAKNREIKVFK